MTSVGVSGAEANVEQAQKEAIKPQVRSFCARRSSGTALLGSSGTALLGRNDFEMVLLASRLIGMLVVQVSPHYCVITRASLRRSRAEIHCPVWVARRSPLRPRLASVELDSNL